MIRRFMFRSTRTSKTDLTDRQAIVAFSKQFADYGSKSRAVSAITGHIRPC